MAWIKRNLYFVIGSVVAVLLMGAGGWFLFSKWTVNNQIVEKLNQDYEELKRLNGETPHPGAGQVNNIQVAKEQQQELRAFIQKSRAHFQPIEPVPNLPKLTDRDFSAALSRTISDLQHQANEASVALTTNFNFSFEAQKQKVSFSAGSLAPLSVQLGEVKAICDLLLKARINALDYVRRERVCTDDQAASGQMDYLNSLPETNNLAVLAHYELGFRCFSSELATVMAGLAGSSHGLLIKSINVEPAAASAAVPYGQPGYPTAFPPGYMPGMPTPPPGEGMMGGMAVPGYPHPAPATSAKRTGALPTVLDEKPLKITLSLVVVKLLPSK